MDWPAIHGAGGYTVGHQRDDGKGKQDCQNPPDDAARGNPRPEDFQHLPCPSGHDDQGGEGIAADHSDKGCPEPESPVIGRSEPRRVRGTKDERASEQYS